MCRNLCENFRQIWQIMKKLPIAYTSWVVRCDLVQSVEPAVPHTREGRGWGNGPMYWFFFFGRHLMLFLPSISHVATYYAKEMGVTAEHTSVTHQTWWREVAKYIPLLADVSLAVLSDISKLDCTGQKVDNLRNCWAYINVFGLILKWKSHAIA